MMNPNIPTNRAISADYFTAVDEQVVDHHSIRVFPNPTNSSVWVEAANEIENIALYNIRGQQILQYPNKGQSTRGNLTELPSSNGTYVLQVMTEKGVVTQRLIFGE